MPLCDLLVDLSKHKRYEIRLSVYNAVGEGPSSAPQEVFVGEAGVYSCQTELLVLICKIFILFVFYKAIYFSISTSFQSQQLHLKMWWCSPQQPLSWMSHGTHLL